MEYEITKDCKIYNKLGKEKIQQKDKKGYYAVIFYDKGKLKRHLVHRLFAQKYIPNPENKCCINHIDGNPSNNSITNLEWVTIAENNIHASRVLGKNKTRMSLRMFSEETIKEIRKKYIPKVYSYRMLAEEYNTSHVTIIHIIKNKRYFQF